MIIALFWNFRRVKFQKAQTSMTLWRKPETTPIFWSDFSLPEICRNGSQSVFIWCFQNKTENVLTYNLTSRRVQLTIIAVEIVKHYVFWVCVCVCVCVGGGGAIYQTSNVRAPYFNLWPLWFCNICPHYPINGTIFRTKLRNTKYVIWFSLQFSLKYLSF